MRLSLLVAGVASLCNVAFAQTVDQGKKFLYYQRYKSANDVFDKVLASNPNNIDAVYWKGQTLLAMKDSVGAGDLYSKALTTNGNAPMLLAGMGGVELRNHKTADAKQRFETAISLSKAKDINVLNAVADANIDARDGDAAYAIEKLNLATQIKNFNVAETYVLMGDAYRKQIDGGNAVQSYQKALTLDPKNAEAKYKIGRIYETQNNPEFFLPAYEQAVTMDPNYAPAFYEMYIYYFNHGNVQKATENLDKYIAVADPSPAVDYDRTSILWISKKYDEAIAASKNYISTLADKADPRYYKLIAYSYDSKGDSVNAKDFMTQYFSKQKPEGFVPKDYSFYASLLAKFPGNEADVAKNYQLAIDKDTVLADKLDIIKEASATAKARGDKAGYANWLGVAYTMNKNPNQNDLYNWGFAHYSAGNYKTSDSIFCGIYESKYPAEIFGYLWCMKSKVAMDDSTGSQGLAVDAHMKLAEVARALDSTAKAANSPDSIKYKNTIIGSYFALAQYYNDIKKDKGAAVSWLQKVLEVDPTNTTADKFVKALTAPPPQRQPARPAGATKPKPGGAK
ncbi:MAG: tetratricopeptide repeat protein [Bacteroidetes bacterium]|nr:tetratricopeptide repeat protein [Bacteroidota bacterium]